MRVSNGKSYPAPEIGPDSARKALLAVEWVSKDHWDRHNPSCPACHNYRHSGHKPGCIVAEGLGRPAWLPGVVRVWEHGFPGWPYKAVKTPRVTAEIVLTDELEAYARRFCAEYRVDPDGAAPDPRCTPGSPAAAEDKVPAWWAALYDLLAHEVLPDEFAGQVLRYDPHGQWIDEPYQDRDAAA